MSSRWEETPVRLSAGQLDEARFDRAQRLGWFDLDRMRRGRVLVVGCGALGNEAVKNLALAGVGHLDLVDADVVVPSNLPRCALFGVEDAARRRPKAEALAEAGRRLDPDCRLTPYVGAVEDLPEKLFAAADVLLSCVDNIGTRVYLNARATRLRLPLVDGGTRGTLGKVQVVLGGTACLECGMNRTHMAVVADRASCTGRDLSVFEPKMAADLPTTAIVAAIQAREAVKLLHGMRDRCLTGVFYYDGMANTSEVLELPLNPLCPHHDPPVNP